MIRSLTLLVLIALICGTVIWGTAATAQGQTLQLPTFQFFTTSTTVSVPDRGEVLLGSVGRASEGRNDAGVPGAGRPFRNSGSGRSTGASTTSVKVFIHDLEAMDAAVLAEARRRRGGRDVQLAEGNQRGTPFQADPNLLSIAEIRGRQAEEFRLHQEKLAAMYQKGRDAEARGKTKLANLYYRLVARESMGKLKHSAIARVDAIRAADASAVR